MIRTELIKTYTLFDRNNNKLKFYKGSRYPLGHIVVWYGELGYSVLKGTHVMIMNFYVYKHNHEFEEKCRDKVKKGYTECSQEQLIKQLAPNKESDHHNVYAEKMNKLFKMLLTIPESKWEYFSVPQYINQVSSIKYNTIFQSKNPTKSHLTYMNEIYKDIKEISVGV